MIDAPALPTLRAALPRVMDGLPKDALWRLFGAVPGLASALPAEARLQAEQRFKPVHQALIDEGRVTLPADEASAGMDAPAWPDAAPSRIIVMLPRSREEGRSLLARAIVEVAAGGVVIGAALNDEGARSFEKDLASLMPLGGQLSKSHGRAFWTVPRPATLAEDTQTLAAKWLAADAPRFDPSSGLWQRPGVFNEGRLDAGSALLLEHLPTDLRGAVADLGAGTGILSKAVLERCPGVTLVELFEAEARAVDLARRNLADARVPARVHWHDVAQGVPGRFDAIVCNPPFHVGSRGVPALGRAFIAAAARALSREGPLLLVANRHLPYEEALRVAFSRGELLAEQGGFKVYRAWSPRP